MLGTTARQSTVSFVVVEGLQVETNLISQEVRVELVPVPVSLALSVLPQSIGELEPRGEVTAEFRVRANVLGSDGELFDGPIALVLDTTVTEVTAGVAGDIDLSFESLAEIAAGVYESTVRVTIAAGQVSMASVKITVADGGTSGLASVPVTVQLARRVPLASLMLLLADSELRQAEAGAAVQTTATVVALDRDGLPVMPVGLQLSVVDIADESVVRVVELVFDEQGQAQSVLTLTPPRGRDQNLRVEVTGVTAPEVKTSTAALSLIAVEVLDSLTVAVPASTLTQTMPAEAVLFELTVTAVGTKDTLLEPAGLALTTTAAPGVRVAVDSTLTFSAGVAKVVVSVTPVPGVDAAVIFGVTGDPDDLAGVSTNMITVDVGAVEVLNTVTLTVQNGLMRTVQSGQEVLTIEVQLRAEYLGENKPEQTVLQLRAVGTNGVAVSGPADDVVIPTGGFTTTTLSLVLGTTARQATVSFAVVELPSGVSLISPEVRVELVPVPVSLALSATPQRIEELEPRDAVTAEFRVRVDVQGSDELPFDGPIDLLLDTTVAAVADGDKGDLTFSLAALTKTAAGVYESTVRVTIAALRVSAASVEIAVEGAGLAGSVTVQLVRRMTMDSLTLALSDSELQQAEAGASVQTTATVTAVDQFDRPLRPTALRLRVVDTADGSVVLLTTPSLVFDADGQAQSLLRLTPLAGTNQDLRVELVGVTDASIAAAELRIEAAEAVGRVILTVVGGAEQFVSTNSFSIALELSLERAGDRPLTAATALTAQLQISVVGGALVGGPNFAALVSGESPSSVVITGMVAGNASSATITISLSIIAGVPADTSVLIRPTDTVKISMVPALDVDNNAVFDVRDAVLILSAATRRAANNSLPDSLPLSVRMGLERVLSPDNPDMRLDVDGNGMVEPIDVRLLLRYSAGLRGGSLMDNADTEAIERRAKALLAPNR